MAGRELQSGVLVEVRSAEEILATLDDRGELESMPFMPEMLRYCGRRFRVSKRADKVCDTSHQSGSRRVPGAVFLEDLRCDGSAHGRCQADCRIFWKEAWLRQVDPREAPPPATNGAAPDPEGRLSRNTSAEVERDGRTERAFRCQATRLHAASVHLRTFDPRPYFRELQSGNVALPEFLTVTTRAAIREPLLKLGLLSGRPVEGTRTGPAQRGPELGLAPGDWVRVRSKEEIAATLGPGGDHRGLWFDREMLEYCGKVLRVRRRVNRIVNEQTGKMIELKSDCLMLEGAVCSGKYSPSRWFCPRAIYPYWRECWLERVDGPGVG